MIELYKHNLESYNKVKEAFQHSNYVLLSQVMGTGKSYVAMRLMQDDFKDMRVLYVVPKTAIMNNIMLYPEWVQGNTDFVTYAKLTRLDISRMIKSYDVFIFDEVHHAGASIWGKPVKALISSGKYCLGLTATPIRGDGVDVGKEIFNGHVVNGPDAGDAIEQGIWSEFRYVLTVNKIRERLDIAKQEVDSLPACLDTLALKTEAESITLDDASNYTVRNIIESNSDVLSNVQKWLVFCSNMKQVDDIDDDINDWFEYKETIILKVDSRCGSKKVQEAIEYFNNYSDASKVLVLVSVNILTEGLHLNGVSGIVMLRHTESLTIFLQMIGRIMSASSKSVPVVIDVADNLTMLRSILSSMQDKDSTVLDNSDIGQCRAKPSVMISRELSIQTELLVSIEEFIERVKSVNKDNIWTDGELKILRRYYPDVTNRLNKTKVAIRKKAVELGLVVKTQWSVIEDEILKANYPTIGVSVKEMLNNKTVSDVRSRARYLHLKYTSRWSFEEDTMLLKGVEPNNRTHEECSRRLERLRRELT